MKKIFTVIFGYCFLVLIANSETINPFPREIIGRKVAVEWNFDDDNTNGWGADSDCKLSFGKGCLSVTFGDNDPHFSTPNVRIKGPVLVEFRAKSKAPGNGQLFWSTTDFGESPERSANVALIHDGKYHNYSVELPVEGVMKKLRFDPSISAGKIDINWMHLTSLTYHPLEIIEVKTLSDKIIVTVTNHVSRTSKCEPISFFFENQKHILKSGEITQLFKKLRNQIPFETVNIIIENCQNSKGKLQDIKRPVQIIRPNENTEWITLEDKEVKLKVARDGSGAKIFRNNKLVGAISPLLNCSKLTSSICRAKICPSLNKLKFSSREIKKFTLELKNNEIHYELSVPENIEGPVIRVFGDIEQGILAGVEYLGKNEKSSSKLDLITPEHVRFMPDKMWLTMPLMAFVTSNATIAVSYENMTLQPTFATPNFFDGTKDSRMSLCGKNIKATILVDAGWSAGNRLENVIEWFVDKRGLPALPQPPRTEKEQWDLCKKALEGDLKNSNGWGHCFGEMWDRHNFSDYVSAAWLLDNNFYTSNNIVMGGAHIQSHISFFLNGQANRWLETIKGSALNALKDQQPDGSFRFDGKFRKGHFENTASGYCAQNALALLNAAYYTGNKKFLDSGIKALEYIKKFRTPRGSQVWEIPLHTPDILASARIVDAYVKGYELTGTKEYLTIARRWAISGLPFIYFWENKPVMKFSSIAVLGATHWIAPNWIGLPVQWCGLVYADSILDLSKFDTSFDWKKIAKGILIAGEQMQYTAGEVMGCLPDSFTLKTQTPNPHDIGPPALVFLRNRLKGNYHSVYVERNKDHIIISPFPYKLYKNKIIISAKKGIKYQIIINQKIININSKGKDIIEF